MSEQAGTITNAMATVFSPDEFRKRWTQFQRESEPLVAHEIKLYTMFESAILRADGTVEYRYPVAIEKLMREYRELKLMLMRRIMGPFMPIPTERR